MRPLLLLSLCGVLTLSACGFGQSRLNPINWFGSAREEPAASQPAEPEVVNPLIPRRVGLFQRSAERRDVYIGTPVEAVTGLVIERASGGAIIRATGIAANAGVYGVRLTPEKEDEAAVDGVLTYRLEGIVPTNAPVVGNTRQREVTAARSLTDQQLAGVRSIRVESRTNAQVSRR